jgi:hypothetical protein
MIQPQSILQKVKDLVEIYDTEEYDAQVIDHISASYIKLQVEGFPMPTLDENKLPINLSYFNAYVVAVGYNVGMVMNAEGNYSLYFERYKGLVGTLRLLDFSTGEY